MPRWTTRREGGGWLGGGTEVPTCSTNEQLHLRNTFGNFIGETCLDCFPGLRDDLRKRWDEIEVDCREPTDLPSGTVVWYRGGKIEASRSFREYVDGPQLLYSLVLAAGGKQLDARAAQWSCFPGQTGWSPTTDDFKKFVEETEFLERGVYNSAHVGKYVIWHHPTGEVWEKVVEGGGWLGGATIKVGVLCFKSDAWIYQKTIYDLGGW